jgi:nucleoside phosphorylase
VPDLPADIFAPGAEAQLSRHIIDFDPRSPAHYHASAAPGSDAASELAASVQADPIPWPEGLAPLPTKPTAADTDPLPVADVLVVTYTVAEGYALADVLTPGLSTTDWTRYRSGWESLKKEVQKGAPSLEIDAAGLWALTRIGSTRVVVVKSELHPSTDGAKLPLRMLWQQMIDQVQPKLVITTGTAGGIGKETQLGDVIVTKHVRWDCSERFANTPFAHSLYTSSATLATNLFEEVQKTLIPINAAHLPAAPREPVIVRDTTSNSTTTITTDFFAFDDAADHYGLRTYEPDARAVEMDDAALGLACSTLRDAPAWVSVRNASDPQMKADSLAEEKKLAAAIYEKYGYWTSVGSVITCWALIAG